MPQEVFFGGASGFDSTRRPMKPDVAAVTEVFDAIGGKSAVNLLLTGHSHFDHSFDTATWARLSGARIIGSPTTCLQVRAAKIPARRCTPVLGGEKFTLERGVEMYVIRWNHSGDPAKNAEQHNPAELRDPPEPDCHAARFRAGVAEDFPNGGGNRAYLFKVDGPQGQFSWLFQDSASAVDLRVPIVIDGTQLRRAARQSSRGHAGRRARVRRPVDRHRRARCRGAGAAGAQAQGLSTRALGRLVWRIQGGTTATLCRSRRSRRCSSETGVRRDHPGAIHGRWRLDADGIQALDNREIKQKLGFH